MKGLRALIQGAAVGTALTLVLPFVGGAGPAVTSSAQAARGAVAMPTVQTVAAAASIVAASAARPVTATVTAAPKQAAPTSGTRTARSCSASAPAATATAPGRVTGSGVKGTTTADIRAFAKKFNAIRVANCLQPIPASHFKYDKCMENRLIWFAEDPNPDPAHSWGHTASITAKYRPLVGCDGNLAGGTSNSGATVAQKWWDSTAHRKALYRPSYSGSYSGVCVYFAMTHNGIDDNVARAAARWGGC